MKLMPTKDAVVVKFPRETYTLLQDLCTRLTKSGLDHVPLPIAEGVNPQRITQPAVVLMALRTLDYSLKGILYSDWTDETEDAFDELPDD
jgi:hypothetical protein